MASLTLLSASAMSQAESPSRAIPLSELYPPLPGIEYYCTDSQGQRVELGAVICVSASCTTWMAKCEMTASNRMAMWRKVQDGCPMSTLERLDRLKNNT